jgi:hypothetical protein
LPHVIDNAFLEQIGLLTQNRVLDAAIENRRLEMQ